MEKNDFQTKNCGAKSSRKELKEEKGLPQGSFFLLNQLDQRNH